MSYVYMDDESKWQKVFSKDSRASIRNKLSLSVQSFNNALTDMRKNGIIVDNSIPESLCIYPEDVVEVIYKFVIHGT
ncbi:MAG: hypothetical protein V3S79_02870 [Candidatus Thermoplasmatota archaeon]